MQYTVSDKIEGNPWSPTEHNFMKQAINSKLDAAAVITDPNATPSGSTVWSTGAISTFITNIIGGGVIYKGQISGSENLGSIEFTKTGFWIGKDAFFENPVHTSFPINEPGVLTVQGNTGYILQTYVSVLEGNKTFRRSYFTATDTWSGWSASAREEWVIANFAPLPTVSAGTPDISIGDNSGILVDIHNSTDLKGFVSITNNSGTTLTVGTNILISFEFERPNVSVIMLEGYIGVSLVSPYAPPSSTSAIVRLIQDIPNGGVINFFYLIQ